MQKDGKLLFGIAIEEFDKINLGQREGRRIRGFAICKHKCKLILVVGTSLLSLDPNLINKTG
uniref:Uncharacterized protein n=1 Tax=Rhizophagus irregularis (strain DAOM 181602 / DAOM 197198 / MUCL 43194) TaxID=747089 RepID=U9UDZ4_RHIID